MYTHDRSPHTNGAHECGPTFLLALASWTGDSTGDYRVLKQIRYNLNGKYCLVAAGGYGAQRRGLSASGGAADSAAFVPCDIRPAFSAYSLKSER